MPQKGNQQIASNLLFHSVPVLSLHDGFIHLFSSSITILVLISMRFPTLPLFRSYETKTANYCYKMAPLSNK